jgi:hypothetical protein
MSAPPASLALDPALARHGSNHRCRQSRRNKRARLESLFEELWNMPVPSGEQRYYDSMLHLMSMLHCSGNFRARHSQTSLLCTSVCAIPCSPIMELLAHSLPG